MKRSHLALIVCVLMMAGIAIAQTQTDTPPATQPAPAQTAQPAAASPTDTPAASTSTTTALVRVYRQRRYAGSALAPSIFVDDKPVARVGNGRRVTIRLTPGTHTVRSDDKSSVITLDAKAGQEYFIRVEEAAGFWKGHGKLTLLMAEQGLPEFKLQKPIEEDRKVAREMIEADSETPPVPKEKQDKQKEPGK